jgi:phosphatidylglycerophosphate synthase
MSQTHRQSIILDESYTFIAYGAIVLRAFLTLLAVFGMFMTNSLNPIATTIIIIGIMVLDFFDGASFRKSHYNEIKYNRIQFRLLDSTTDRFIIHVGSLGVLFIDHTFIYFYLPILIREIILSGYSISKYYKGYLLYPKTKAKIAAIFVGLSIVSYILFQISLITIMTNILMIVFSVFAFFEYKGRLDIVLSDERINDTNGELVEIL